MMKRLFVMLLCIVLCLPGMAQAAQGLPIQPCHQVKLTDTKTNLPGGARITQWTIDTMQDAVDAELNGLSDAYAAELTPVQKSDGRVNVTVRPSRTGLTWMSFMVQARVTRSQKTQSVAFTTRTYDMTTGERIWLTDIFPADSTAWDLMASAIRDTVNAYYPDEEAPAAALDAATTREAIEQMDFTLHGMSLVLHLDATDFYPNHPQLIEVTLYYPELRPLMTEKAQVETDNLNYYYTAALTIDDGPNGMITEGVLRSLMRNGERATFFLVGVRMEQQAFLVQREHDEGHSIASHNWEHRYAPNLTRGQLRAMPPKIHAAHEAIIGIRPTIMRAPGGRWEGLAQAELGFPYIQWTVSTQDWSGGEKGPDPRGMAGNIAAGIDDGGIILMHDLKENSILAIDLICQRLQQKGYLLLTVEELFAKDGAVLEAEKAYWRCTDGKTTR